MNGGKWREWKGKGRARTLHAIKMQQEIRKNFSLSLMKYLLKSKSINIKCNL